MAGRVFDVEIMAPFQTQTSLVSAVTLAVMEDSGWYVANYSAADAWRPGADFGFQSGCAVARDSPCLVRGTPPSVAVAEPPSANNPRGVRPHYCVAAAGASDVSSRGCTFDARAMAYCDVAVFQSQLPTRYQYFAQEPTWGGATPQQADFCPVLRAFSNRICSNPAHAPAASQSYGWHFGESSMCVQTSLVRTGSGFAAPSHGCVMFRCEDNSNGSPSGVTGVPPSPWLLYLRIPRPGRTGGFTDIECAAPGAAYAVSGYSGTITCPDPRSFCAGVASDGAGAVKIDPTARAVVSMTSTVVNARRPAHGETAGEVFITVERAGGSGVIGVSVRAVVATALELATPGAAAAVASTDFQALVQTIEWSSDDFSPRTVAVPVLPRASRTAPLLTPTSFLVFRVELALPTGGATVAGAGRDASAVRLFDVLPSPSPAARGPDDAALPRTGDSTMRTLVLALFSVIMLLCRV